MIDLDGTVQKCEEENKLGDSIASKVTPGAGVSTDSTTQSYYPGDISDCTFSKSTAMWC